jgi:outer membrane scaffolding protein for murein synthesis (MipA/OmpV family)
MNVTNNCLKTLTLAVGITLAAPSAFAQAFHAVRLDGSASGKDSGTIGVAVIAAYEYRGSDKRRTLLLPLLDYQWVNGWFTGVTNGIGYNFSASPHLQYGLRMTADLGRKENRTNALHGLGDVDPAAEGGAFFNYSTPQGGFITSSVRYGSGSDHKGLIVDIGVGRSIAIGSNWRLTTGTGITLANTHYMQTYFGVTGVQSAASGYDAYSSGAGVRDVRTTVALTYSIDKRISVTAAVSASSLLGDAKNSPLTRKRTSGSGIVAISYAF